MILGLDASTSTVGWSISDNGKVIDAGFLDISKQETSKEKSFCFLDFIKTHPQLKHVTSVNLEAALSGFIGGRTSQQVIIKLARFNAVFEYIISEKLNVTVNLCNVNTMRKQLFGKSRIKGIKPKDYVKMNIGKYIDVDKYDKKKKKGGWDDRNSDMYDAVVCSLYVPGLE